MTGPLCIVSEKQNQKYNAFTILLTTTPKQSHQVSAREARSYSLSATCRQLLTNIIYSQGPISMEKFMVLQDRA